MRLILVLVLVPNLAWAQVPQRVDVAPCRNRVAASMAPDVAYQPGIDASGNAVAPADLGLPAEATNRLEHPTVALDVPLSQVTSNRAAQRPGGFASFGQVELHGNQATLNGESLSPPDACPD